MTRAENKSDLDRFKEIEFGFASAEKEFEERPSLLLDGFFNFRGVIDDLMKSSKFLVLGDKGSGKTSIGRHLELRSNNDPLMFAQIVSLEDLPFNTFGKIVSGNEAPESKYPSAWSWLLFLIIIDRVAADEGLTGENIADFHALHRVLREAGLASQPNVASLIRRVGKKDFAVDLLGLIKYNEQVSSEFRTSNIPAYVDSFKTLFKGIGSFSEHFIIMDGLDDILTKRSIQYDILGALIYETQRLNAFFRNESGLSLKIILLCRQDIFSKVSGANKNKIRQNFAVDLDWYHDPQSPGRSMLVQLVNRRAYAVLGDTKDTLGFFSQDLVEGKEVYHFLLDMTRHRPRDFIVLLAKIQEICYKMPVDRDQIMSGARKYSQDYFLPEIMDELYGFVPQEVVASVFPELTKLKKREFTFEAAQSLLRDRYGDEFDATPLFEVLYDCSAIGNVYKAERNRKYFTFKFRNVSSMFSDRESIIVHRGLWKAMNLI